MPNSPNQALKTSSPPSFEDVRVLVAADMLRVDTCIRENLQSDVVLINQVSEYIIGSGGKRLRPIIHLLSAGACGYQGDQHLRLSAIIEFIHTATLLHDDVVDESSLRRGHKTANAVWGDATSVLVGDFLYSRAFQMMVSVDSMRVMDILARTTNTIAEGEVMQLLYLGNPDTDEERYLEVIRCKTAKLFQAAARLGAVLAGRNSQVEDSLAAYGMHLGSAFQLADDLLDYDGTAEELGKNIGDDLAEGKPTLPLIHVLHTGNSEQQGLIRDVIEHGGLDRMDEVVAAIHDTRALEYTAQRAREASDSAIASLNSIAESDYKHALLTLARYAVERRS
jgi:octaprenyl-diphosphate synthase